MTKLNHDTIQYLTQLSRIKCTEEEKEALLQDLSKILDYIDQLNEIDTENIPTLNNVHEGMNNVMREDVVGEVFPREDFLANAPEQVGGLVRVPPVIKKGT